MHMAMPFMQDMVASVKPWEELTIADNFIFQAVMRKKRCCRRFIESVLGIKVKKITYPVLTEKDIKVRCESKGVRLDVYVEDDQGNIYDIEMQTADYARPDELPKRTRYYQAMIDLDVLNKGESYAKLRQTYIIFVCTFDPFTAGRSIYTFRETCQEDKGILMGDETTKIFLNSKGSREGISKELAAFLDYVEGKAPSSKFTKDLATVVDETKENKDKRVEYMSYMMDMLRSEERGEERGIEKGRKEGIISTFKELVKDGTLTIEAAAKKMGISVDEFRKKAML